MKHLSRIDIEVIAEKIIKACAIFKWKPTDIFDVNMRVWGAKSPSRLLLGKNDETVLPKWILLYQNRYPHLYGKKRMLIQPEEKNVI